MEARTSKRLDHEVEVRFWKEGEEEGPRSGYSKDISQGGMFITTKAPFPPRTRIFVETVGSSALERREAEVVHFIGTLQPKPGAQERRESQFVATAASLGVDDWAESIAPILHRLRPTGMGVRFLEPLSEPPVAPTADAAASLT